MPKCGYCGKEYDVPRGLTLVRLDGKVKYLCSSKCRKNWDLMRRKVRWVSKKKKVKAEKKEEKK